MNTMNTINKTIILGSGSPRRIELLQNEGLNVIVIPPDIDEVVDYTLSPDKIVESLALQKATAVRDKLLEMMGAESSGFSEPEGPSPSDFVPSTALLSSNLPIIAADTIVYHDKIIGKPKDREDALNILMELSGKEHQVYSGVAILELQGPRQDVFNEKTSVYFKEYTEADISSYLDTDEPYDKAGAYAIQGYFGRFIDHIDGDYHNVMGLPVNTLLRYL